MNFDTFNFPSSANQNFNEANEVIWKSQADFRSIFISFIYIYYSLISFSSYENIMFKFVPPEINLKI